MAGIPRKATKRHCAVGADEKTLKVGQVGQGKPGHKQKDECRCSGANAGLWIEQTRAKALIGNLYSLLFRSN